MIMEFYYLPGEYKAIHTACFELIRQIEAKNVKMWERFVTFVEVSMNMYGNID